MADLPRRHFIPWNRPLLPQAVAWLAGDWSGGSPLDLSRLLVVVPTRQSGRRLREALAEAAAGHGQAVFPPRVVTPDLLLAPATAADVAPRLGSLLAWVEVLRGIEWAEFRDVFPVDPPTRSFAWALRLARGFARLQANLAEGGLRMRDVVERAGPDFPETDRWVQLGELERLHAQRLASAGLRDAQAAKISAARQPPSLPEIERIVVLATPDPMPLALEALAGHLRLLPVDVVVFAPPAEAANFDPWGRPAEAAGGQGEGHEGWAQRAIPLPDFEDRVRLFADPAAQAERVAAIAASYEQPGTRLAIGVADPEILPCLEHALGRLGVPAFNPEGRARQHDALHALLAALGALAAEPDFDRAAALLRCPDVLAWLQGRSAGNFSAAGLLVELDALRSNHLPPTLAAARVHATGFPMASRALEALAELHGVLTGGRFPANAASALSLIFAGRRVEAAGPLAESAEVWNQIVREASRAFALFPGAQITTAEAWEFGLAEFAEALHTRERPAEAVDLLGWLELLWDDAPHLVVAGFNDGRVPDAVSGDAFVPENLRVRLGLKSNTARFARDAYLLSALAAPRAGDGRLDLFFGKATAAGDPLRPSRLLLRCPEADLPGRVARLFRASEPARPSLPWSRSWRLKPRRLAAPGRISVTGLRDWLHCPFRYYLRHVLRLDRVEPAKTELDAGDFGTLLHHALQQLGEDQTLRDCQDPDRLGEFLLGRFDRAAGGRYGAELTLPLLAQFESARQRLRAAAAVEARERADGWRTERVEWKFSFPLGGLTLSGKIDRIDRHPDGRVRVLDYKTGDAASPPAENHLRPPRAADDGRPGWLRVDDDAGKARVWIDLQLPLYLRAVAAGWGDTVSCGYFNLPKAAGETAVVPWDGLTRELQAAAEHCAEQAARAVAAGIFWPPVELTGRAAEWDEFAELFHDGAAASVEFGGGT